MKRVSKVARESIAPGRDKLRLYTLLLLLFFSSAIFADQRSVVLITIDTLRADYVGYSGSKKVETPVLDRLARSGVIFTSARTPVPLTLPAHTSILTGLYPPSSGVRDNGGYRLDDSKTTLAEVFKKHGYITAAFTSSFVLDHRFGLGQGFDHYDDRIPQTQLAAENPEAERNAEQTYAAFQTWLSKVNEASPYFLWLHFYDPHAPYTPPEKFRRKYPHNPYAGEVAYVDEVIGKVLQDLRAKKNFANAIIAVSGDHGEGLGEHNENTHSVLVYNSTLHVPMLIVAPGAITPGSKVAALCRTIDLAPTILSYAGFSAQFGEGSDLHDLIEHKNSEGREVYSESLYPKFNLGWSELKGMEAGKYHFILAPKSELYDLSTDPNETLNIIEKNHSVAMELRRKLESVDGGKEQAPQKIDAETAEKLSSLGYVSGGARPAENTGIDPKSKMNVWNEIQFALFEFSSGRYRLAAERLEKLTATERTNALVYDYLCSSRTRLEDWVAAEKCYQKALQNGIRSASIYENLGILHYHLQHYEEAVQELQKALQIDPLNVTAHYYLGDVFRARGQLADAVVHYQQALKINPGYVFALNAVGMSYSMMRRDSEALDAFQKALRVDPKNPSAHYNLAVQLERMGRNEEALKTFQEFLKLSDSREFALQREKAQAAIRRLKHN